MKVISTGSRFNIYPDDLKSYDRLPADYYIVRFSLNEGFYLERYSEFMISDSKIYGVHTQKAEKVFDAYSAFNRNLGVILSGDKGIGKSLFARLLGRMAVNNNVPVIIVDTYTHGIGTFIDRLEQRVMVLFDEFDKIFAKKQDDEDPQANLLSLFDGVSQGQKLFVVTCNELRNLNGFLVNRPGRFHYHFRFDSPSDNDIREYLGDMLQDEYKSEIDKVISFSRRVSLNYDCLRAIAFELNRGQVFTEAIKDLNIINIEKEKFKLQAVFNDGKILINRSVRMDSFSNNNETFNLYEISGGYAGEITFSPAKINYNPTTGELTLSGEDAKLDYDSYDYENEENAKRRDKLIAIGLKKVIISRLHDTEIHYAM